MIKAWQSMALMSAEVLDSCKKVENQLVSFAAVGVSMDEEAVQEATSTCQAADKTIQVPLLDICHDPCKSHGKFHYSGTSAILPYKATDAKHKHKA